MSWQKHEPYHHAVAFLSVSNCRLHQVSYYVLNRLPYPYHKSGRTIPIYQHQYKQSLQCKSNEGEEGYVRIIEKKRKKMLLPLILIFALLVGGGIWWALNRQPKVDLDKEAIAYQMPNGMKNENPNEIMIPVFSELTMKTGKNKVEAGLVNPEGNPCYFKYQIYLKEGNKLLYESKWLEPGTAIVEIEIKEKFEVGNYPITISVKTGSLKDPEVEMNGGEVETILKVE